MKTSEKHPKNRQPIAPRFGNFYIVRAGTVEKQSSSPVQQKLPTGKRISAEAAAKKIFQRFGRSLAVLAD